MAYVDEAQTARDNGGEDLAPLLTAQGLSVSFRGRGGIGRRRMVHAVRNVSVELEAGRTFGLLGESGSGKSTLGRLLLHIIRPDSGQIRVRGEDLWSLREKERRLHRRHLQMVFQDPYSSFDPSVPLLDSLEEPLRVHTNLPSHGRRERIDEVVEAVGLSGRHIQRYPRDLSGGQLQRVAIARALTLSPDLLVLDEPVSALDMSTQAQIINLLQELQESRGLAYVFISHNPSVVHHLSHRIGVMHLGSMVEVGTADDVVENPQDPYTRTLLNAVLRPDPDQPRARKARKNDALHLPDTPLALSPE